MTRNPEAGSTYKMLFHLIRSYRVLLAYEGSFDQELVKGFLSMTEGALSEHRVEDTVKKKLFNVMMESLQNVCKHQAGQGETAEPAIFLLSADSANYYVHTGNMIRNDRVQPLQEKLDALNKLSAAELKELYKQVRLNGSISDVGGAGLGFIDIMRKTGNPLKYDFRNVSEDVSFFTLISTISIEVK